MIRYALVCDQDHGFEAWFGSSDDFDVQAAKGQLECPWCASRAVRKQIMAPAVAGARSGETETPAERLQALMMQAAAAARTHVEANFDYVGDAFAREARAIHAGESEARPIYGEATPAEVRDLKADGVPCAPLPPALAPKPAGKLN